MLSTYVYSEVKVSITCAKCGTTEETTDEMSDDAERRLVRWLERLGWKEIDEKPYCPDCAKGRETR